MVLLVIGGCGDKRARRPPRGLSLIGGIDLDLTSWGVCTLGGKAPLIHPIKVDLTVLGGLRDIRQITDPLCDSPDRRRKMNRENDSGHRRTVLRNRGGAQPSRGDNWGG